MAKVFKFGCLTVAGLVIFVVVIGVLASGSGGTAGGSSASGSRASSGSDTGTTDAPTLYALGDRIELGSFAYTVHSHRTTTVIGDPDMWGVRAGSGARFVIIEYTIENLTNETKTVMADDLSLLDGRSRKFTSSSEATTALLTEEGQDFIFSELQPGLPKRTMTAFKVPQDATTGELTVLIPEKGLFSRGEAKVKLK